MDETVAGLMQELRRGTLILLVLSQLKQPRYGYDLVKRLSDRGIPMDANTLYPLMRRLENQGLIQSQWDTGEGKPRKYYRITADGEAVLEKTKSYWDVFSRNVNALLEETE
jgi:DNA-binding PadR family transcriptional regulator